MHQPQQGDTATRTASAVASGEYESGLFTDLTAAVEAFGGSVDVLDLGPTTPANLMFWVRRGHRVAAHDLMARHARGDSALVLGAERAFGAIVAWNVFSYLPRSDARALMAELRGYLLPGGALFAIFDGDGRRAPAAIRYRILTQGRLAFDELPDAPGTRAVPTSEIEALLGGLPPARISVLRHGSREALARRPREGES